MKNHKGIDGVINIDGKLGSPAYILPINSKNFLDEIEDGIKETVVVFIKSGYKTVSSCQGHRDAEYCLRNIAFLVENCEISLWKSIVAKINISNNFDKPLTYYILNFDDNRKIFNIIIGSIFNIKDTLKKQKCLNECVENIQNEKYLFQICRFDELNFEEKLEHQNIYSEDFISKF